MILFGDNNKKVVPSLISLLILLISLSRSECGQIRCMEKEREALLLFKEGLTDENGIFSSWHADDCCEWHGVRCNNRTSQVTALDLSFGLQGKLGTSLVELQHLTYLDMSFSKNYGSPIPKFIGSLSKLKYLNLTHCYFSGAIPDQFGNLSNLHSLDLSFNYDLDVKNLKWLSHLSSMRRLYLSHVNLSKANDWPQAINRLPFLTELKLGSCGLTQILATQFALFNSSMSISILDLSNNPFDIELSRCQWLFNFSSLTSISLSGTGLLGPIPYDFGKMKSLEYPYLFQNELEGSITNCFSNICSLSLLDLSDNYLNGSIPPSFVKLQRLEVLRLGNNQFQGAFPDFLQPIPLRELHLNGNKIDGTIPPSIGNFSEIEYLDLSSNHFTGLISEAHLKNLSKLRIFRISYNSLILKFNSDWNPPFNLTEIWFTNCKIGPHFPSWLQSQKYIQYIDISGSGIVDTIPNWFGNFSSQLSYVNMSNNHIHGILPRLSFNLETAWVDFNSNNIEGLIPKFPSNIVYLSLSNNKLEGSIASICNQTSTMMYLDLSNNLLSGKIPVCLMQSKYLLYLKLESNNFSGSIPNSIGQLAQIRSLHLRNNSLHGELPTSLRQCKELIVIDIGQNKFRGRIPTWLGRNIRNLFILSLRSNQFNGEVPSNICNLTILQILDLSSNNIFGIIPNCLRNLTAMTQKGSSDSVFTNFILEDKLLKKKTNEFASVVWKGIESEYINTLGLVKMIDLSSNNLSGEIPSDITYLEGLIGLNISRNNLHGKIPPEIGHLQSLDFLDLSRNQLSGVIPRSLSQLSSIGDLDLSCNNLSGRIPSSTQLQSFNASSYSENLGLCGLPLPKLCPEDQINFSSGGNQDSKFEGKERFIDPSFYTALGIGFAFGLLGTLGSLIVNNSWKVAYFRLMSNIQDSLYVTIAVNTAKLRWLFNK